MPSTRFLNTVSQPRSGFLSWVLAWTMIAGFLIGDLRAQGNENSPLTVAAIRLTKQVKRTWGASILCGCPFDPNPDNVAYYISKGLYNFWYEARRFVHFTRKPPRQAANMEILFDRLQSFESQVDARLAQQDACFFSPPCSMTTSWAETKERMAQLSEVFGSILMGEEPEIVFPDEPEELEGWDTPLEDPRLNE